MGGDTTPPVYPEHHALDNDDESGAELIVHMEVETVANTEA